MTDLELRVLALERALGLPGGKDHHQLTSSPSQQKSEQRIAQLERALAASACRIDHLVAGYDLKVQQLEAAQRRIAELTR